MTSQRLETLTFNLNQFNYIEFKLTFLHPTPGPLCRARYTLLSARFTPPPDDTLRHFSTFRFFSILENFLYNDCYDSRRPDRPLEKSSKKSRRAFFRAKSMFAIFVTSSDVMDQTPWLTPRKRLPTTSPGKASKTQFLLSVLLKKLQNGNLCSTECSTLLARSGWPLAPPESQTLPVD